MIAKKNFRFYFLNFNQHAIKFCCFHHHSLSSPFFSSSSLFVPLKLFCFFITKTYFPCQQIQSNYQKNKAKKAQSFVGIYFMCASPKKRRNFFCLGDMFTLISSTFFQSLAFLKCCESQSSLTVMWPVLNIETFSSLSVVLINTEITLFRQLP